MTRKLFHNGSAHELASFPSGQADRIAAFRDGANAVLQRLESPTGADDPVKIELEFRKSGNCHIWLVYGRWVGPYTPEFPSVISFEKTEK